MAETSVRGLIQVIVYGVCVCLCDLTTLVEDSFAPALQVAVTFKWMAERDKAEAGPGMQGLGF